MRNSTKGIDQITDISRKNKQIIHERTDSLRASTANSVDAARGVRTGDLPGDLPDGRGDLRPTLPTS